METHGWGNKERKGRTKREGESRGENIRLTEIEGDLEMKREG